MSQGLADIHILGTFGVVQCLELSGIPSFASRCSIVQPGYNRVSTPGLRLSSRLFYRKGDWNKERCHSRRQALLKGAIGFPNPSRRRPISPTPILDWEPFPRARFQRVSMVEPVTYQTTQSEELSRAAEPSSRIRARGWWVRLLGVGRRPRVELDMDGGLSLALG